MQSHVARAVPATGYLNRHFIAPAVQIRLCGLYRRPDVVFVASADLHLPIGTRGGKWVAVGSGATITLSGLNLSEALMNVRELIAELKTFPQDALVVAPAEPFGLTDSLAVTRVGIKALRTRIAGVSHCEADDPRGSGVNVYAVCLGPAGGLGCS